MADKNNIEMTDTQRFVKAVAEDDKNTARKSLERILKEKARKRVDDTLEG